MAAMTAEKPLHLTRANLMNGEELLTEFSNETRATLTLEQILRSAKRVSSRPQIGG